MKTIWLVETGFDNSDGKLIDALHDIDHVQVVTFRKRPFETVDFSGLALGNKPVMVYGSINFVQDFQRSNLPAFPGSYATFKNYLCTRYYHEYYDEILNRDSVLMTAGSIMKTKMQLDDDNIFIRPDRADKPFIGQVVQHMTGVKKVVNKYLGIGSLFPHDLILMSDTEKIKCEARILVVDGEVVTGSMYGKNRNYETLSRLEMFKDFIRGLNLLYRPDPAFSVDVVLTNTGEIKIAELSAFSCIGLYDMNVPKAARAVNELIIKEWEENKA